MYFEELKLQDKFTSEKYPNIVFSRAKDINATCCSSPSNAVFRDENNVKHRRYFEPKDQVERVE